MMNELKVFAGNLGNIATIVGFICLLVTTFTPQASQMCRVD